MPVTRRELLRAAGMIPVGAGAAFLAARIADVIGSTAAAIRPAGLGTSATRCAVCGATGHTMLDPACPAARKVI